MRRWQIVVGMILLLSFPAGLGAQSAEPNRVGLVVQYGDGTVATHCVEFGQPSISIAPWARPCARLRTTVVFFLPISAFASAMVPPVSTGLTIISSMAFGNTLVLAPALINSTRVMWMLGPGARAA